MNGNQIIIGGASGYWGEASFASSQLLSVEGLDFLVYDYLAEITMSILARARAKDSSKGYATDFLTGALKPNLSQIAGKGVRIISNAGGVNPQACAEAVRTEVAALGLQLKVACIEGDDLTERAGDFENEAEPDTGLAFPSKDSISSINAYLGAFPIAAALDAGADIVITGRCVDSAVTLGACVHSFGWKNSDLDRLAAGSLAGHILECGPQSTGGNFTDWRSSGNIAEIGYPVAEIDPEGTAVITKPQGTGGLVSPATVGEQMLYEIGNPQSYILPDVICDFSQVSLIQSGMERVKVIGARGRSPTGSLKVSATYADGFRAGQLFTFNGKDAREKAAVFADAVLKRSRTVLKRMKAPKYTETSVEIFGGLLPAENYEEVVLKAAVRHPDQLGVEVFLKEMAGMGLATPPGLSIFTGAGRQKPAPVVRLFSFLIKSNAVPVHLTVEGETVEFKPPDPPQPQPDPVSTPPPFPVKASSGTPLVERPLEALAWARSGDKGDTANIGVIARCPEYLPWIWKALDEETIKECFSHYLKGRVERFHLPGNHSMNILMHDVLGGGGIASLRNDAQGKGYSQMLLSLTISLPEDLAPSENQGDME